MSTLSELAVIDAPSADHIARINAEHLITTPLRPADLLFVFGTRRGVRETIEAAADLWHRGLFGHAIVSGGMMPGDTRTECTIIKEGMVQGGVPADRILEEHRATNTGQNVEFGLPVIEAAMRLETVRSVICLGKVCTSRRYPMTLQRYWPSVEKMLTVVNHYGVPVERWHTDPVFRERVLLEDAKIAPYRAKGFIADWP